MLQMDQPEIIRERPFGLYVVICLQVIIALSLTAGLLLFQLAEMEVPLLLRNEVLIAAYGWTVVIAFLTASLGLLRLRRWGWTLSMILVGSTLAYNIWLYFQGNAHYLDMASQIIIIFYLNQRDVQAPFTRDDTAEETV